jgi:hypothetical protein
MDPKFESALRRACDQLGLSGDLLVETTRSKLDLSKPHPDVKPVKRPRKTEAEKTES